MDELQEVDQGYSRFVTRPVQAVWHGLRTAWRWTYQYFRQDSTERGEQFFPLVGYGAAVGAMSLRFLVDFINITLLSSLSEEDNASAIAGTGLVVIFLVSAPTAMLLYRFQAILSDGYRSNALLKPWMTTAMAVGVLAVTNYAMLIPAQKLLGMLNDDPGVSEGAALLMQQYLYSGGPLFFLGNTLGIVSASSAHSSHFDLIANSARAVAVLSLSAWYLHSTGLMAIRSFATTFTLAGFLTPSLVHTGLFFYKHRDKLQRTEPWSKLLSQSIRNGLKGIYVGLPYAGSALFEVTSFAVIFNVLATQQGVPTLQALNGYCTLRMLCVLPLGLGGQYQLNFAIRAQAQKKQMQKIQQITSSYFRCTVLFSVVGGAICLSLAPRLAVLYGAEQAYFSYTNMALWCTGATLDTLESVGEGWLRGINKSALAMSINAASFVQFPVYSYLFLSKDLGFISFPLAYCVSQVFAGVGACTAVVYYMKYRLPKQFAEIVLPHETHCLDEVTAPLIVEEAVFRSGLQPAIQIDRLGRDQWEASQAEGAADALLHRPSVTLS